jgi:hypothetical protein
VIDIADLVFQWRADGPTILDIEQFHVADGERAFLALFEDETALGSCPLDTHYRACAIAPEISWTLVIRAAQ